MKALYPGGNTMNDAQQNLGISLDFKTPKTWEQDRITQIFLSEMIWWLKSLSLSTFDWFNFPIEK